MFQAVRQIRLIIWCCWGFLVPLNLAFSQSNDSIIFCGKIINSDSSQPITFRFYKDFLSLEEVSYTAIIQQDSFFIKIPFRENTPGFIAYNTINVPIFIEKADNIHVQFDAHDFLNTLTYRGKGSLANTYLKATFLKFDATDVQKIEKEVTRNTATNYKIVLGNYKAERLTFLTNFLTKRDTQFTEPFAAYVQADINYWWGTNLLRYREEHPASAVLPVSIALSDDYFSFMNDLNINNEAVLNNLHYLSYLDQYTKWRQDRIAKGKLKFKAVNKVQKKQVKVKMVETFGQVLIDALEVREKAYDGLSTFAKLSRGSEVLYLQDITTDRFMYPYKGKRYRDKFLKIELPDGRKGWVFRGGINLKQKIVYTKKWVEIPDARPALLRNFKYANFKGKVLHYAIAKDLYQKIVNNEQFDAEQLADYLEKAPDNPYKATLNTTYQAIKNQKVHTLAKEIEQKKPATVSNLLKEITTATAQKRIEKNKNKVIAVAPELPQEVVISPPDFNKFSRATSISGNIGRHTNKPELVINTNPLLREATTFNFSNTSDKDFLVDFALKSTTTASIKLGKQYLNLYLQPGYELEIDIKGNDLYKDLEFRGKGSEINTYLVTAAKQFRKATLHLEHKIQHASPTEFKVFMEKVRDEKFQFLRTYLETHALPADVIKYARADINYWYAFNLMNYPYEHPIANDQPAPMSVPADYYDFIERVAVNNDGALPNKYYIYYLQDYLSYKGSQTANKGLNNLQLADKYLRGKPLYFYKALQFSVALKRKDDPSTEQAAYQFIHNCPYELYAEYVKLAYHESRGITKGMNAPDFELVDKDGNIISLTDLKGKVVFLDFWATWCRPCKRLEPAHQQLQQQFKEDNVVFLYISMDKNANAWRSYLQKGTLPGTHLFANEAVIKSYKVDTLPYSLLINTDGKIVWQHTGGFSVQRTAQKILALLQ